MTRSRTAPKPVMRRRKGRIFRRLIRFSGIARILEKSIGGASAARHRHRNSRTRSAIIAVLPRLCYPVDGVRPGRVCHSYRLQCGPSARTGNAIRDQAVVALELSERGFSRGPESTVSIHLQPGLDPFYQVAAVAAS